MDARQQFRRMALAAQDRDLTSVAFAVEGEVAQPTIRMHNTARLNRLLHEGHQTVRRSVRNATHANASDPPAFRLRRHHNQGLALRFAAPHTLFRSPHGSLVDLDSSRQSIPARSHHRPPQFVQPTPRGLVTAQPQHALQAEGADAILLAGHPPQSVEPHLQRGARVLKNRPRSQRSLVRAVRTLPERRTQPPRPAFPTPGAAEPFRPAHPEKIVTTGFLRTEAPYEVRQRARIVFHGLLHYLLWLPESNGYPLFSIFRLGPLGPTTEAERNRHAGVAQLFGEDGVDECAGDDHASDAYRSDALRGGSARAAVLEQAALEDANHGAEDGLEGAPGRLAAARDVRGQGDHGAGILNVLKMLAGKISADDLGTDVGGGEVHFHALP